MDVETDIELELPGPLVEFFEHGLITEEISVIKSGKEATAYRCRGTRKLGEPFAVAKVYHERTRRNFKSGSVYQEGRVILKGQVRRAVEKHTGFGQEAAEALWVDHEFEWMSTLNYAGADVPAPFVCNERALLMEYVGDDEAPAPQLQHADVPRGEAEALLERALWNVEVMLREHCVHGDLSAFNILYDAGRLAIIDLPQCIDPRQSQRARELLGRDIENVARYFRRFGLEVDAERHASRLWRRYRLAEL